MKTIKWIVCLGALALVFGCGRSSETSSTSTEQTATNTQRAAGQETNALAPTSRDTNAASRLYSGDTNTSATEPGNTGENVRDRSDTAVTSGDQGGSDADRETTRRIRRAITSNDQLSTDAKNIKIITSNGRVTLRGPVDSQQEANTISSIVQQMGITTLDNQLEVKSR